MWKLTLGYGIQKELKDWVKFVGQPWKDMAVEWNMWNPTKARIQQSILYVGYYYVGEHVEPN